MEHTVVTTDSDFYVGQVKWFNSKSGYGFITIKNECDKKDNDIFVHYTNILTDSQYKYLLQGEYVQFKLLTSVNESHEFQASEISGILGGELMCQVRRSIVKPDSDSTRKSKSRSQRTKKDDNVVVEN
tara:strand:+ start:279 stop:662 length:384 start_codon:yes stop_codon:yes gene_type:complete